MGGEEILGVGAENVAEQPDGAQVTFNIGKIQMHAYCRP